MKGIFHKLQDAYAFAKEAHKGQERKCGGAFIEHPIRVSMGAVATESPDFHALRYLDCQIVGLLHDVIEDTEHTRETLVGSGFGQWADDVYALSRRSPQECEYCAPQWEETHNVSEYCKFQKGKHCCQTYWDFIRDTREYAIAKASDRTLGVDWRHETVIRVKVADIRDNMETADQLGPTMRERYVRAMRILLTEGE